VTRAHVARQALGHHGDVLLAYEMNGLPLGREHGAPLRAVVPGFLGVRSAKWVTDVVTAAEPIETEWQTGFSYRAFPPNLAELPEDLSPYPPVQELPVQSAMVAPVDGEQVWPPPPPPPTSWPGARRAAPRGTPRVTPRPGAGGGGGGDHLGPGPEGLRVGGRRPQDRPGRRLRRRCATLGPRASGGARRRCGRRLA
jgi:hypothetical protein